MPPSASTNTNTTGGTPTSDGKKSKADGQWLFLQDASELLGVHEKTLRRHIKRGILKAKKGKAANSKIQVLVTAEFEAKISKDHDSEEHDDDSLEGVYIEVDVEDASEDAISNSTEVKDFSPGRERDPKDDLKHVEAIVGVVLAPILKKLDDQTELLRQQEREIEKQKIELRLLPDLQSRREEERKAREAVELEKAALYKQVEVLQAEHEALKAEQIELKAIAEKNAELEKQLKLANRTWWQKLIASPES